MSSYTDSLVRWVETQAADLPPGSLLPADSALAGRFNLSRRTVASVMQQCAQRGLVLRIQGKGTFVPGEPALESPPEATISSAEKLAQDIKTAIYRGEYRVGQELPGNTFLTIQYRISSRTVTRAFRLLQREGIVQKVGRGYWVGGLQRHVHAKPAHDVMFFPETWETLERHFTDEPRALLFRKFESELMHCGYSLCTELIDTIGAHTDRWKRPGAAVPSALVFSDVYDESSFDRIRTSLGPFRNWYERTLGMRMPVVIAFGKNFGHASPFLVLHHGHVRTVMMRNLARFIIDRGYHQALFHWNEAYDKNPYGFSDIVRVLPELRHGGFAGDIAFVVKPQHPNGTAEGFINGYYPTDGLPVLDGVLSKYSSMKWPEVLPYITVLHPGEHFRAPPAPRKVCVFSHDADAAQWLTTMSRYRRDPGHVISLVNGRHAYRHGITCLIPDYEMMGYQLAHYIIGDFPVTKSRRGYLDVAVQMLFRKTT